MRVVLILAGGLVLAGLVVSRPLLQVWSDGFPLSSFPTADGGVLVRVPGDSLQLYYFLWLVRDQIFGQTTLAQDPYQFRLDGPRGSVLQSFPPLSLLFATLRPVGDAAAFNTLVLLSFPLSCLAVYALARHYTGHAAGAAAAGIAFALAPARLERLFGGQPAGLVVGLVPLALWGLEVTLTRARVWGGAAGGLALVALGMVEPHYAYFAAGLVAGRLGLWAALRERNAVAPWRPLLVFLILAAGGAGWLLMLREEFLVGSALEAGRTLAEVRAHAPGPGALLESRTYGSLSLLALGLAGLAIRDPGDRGIRLFYGAVAGIGTFLSLGPTVSAIPVYELLHRWVPALGLVRNVERFRILVSLGLAVLAAYAVRALDRGALRGVAPLGGWALAAVVAAGTVPWHAIAVTRFPESATYAVMRAEASRALYLPILPGDSVAASAYLYHATRTRVPMLNGYSPFAPPRYQAQVVLPLAGLNVGSLGPAEHAVLRRLSVTHLVLDRAQPPTGAFPTALLRDRLRASPRLTAESDADPLWLFRVKELPAETPVPLPTSPAGVFIEADAIPGDTGGPGDDESASQGRAVVARPGADGPGFLLRGATRPLPPGAYRAWFRVRGVGLAPSVLAGPGGRVLAEQRIARAPDWEHVAVGFDLDRVSPLGLRVHWSGRGEARVDWVTIVFADRPEPEWAFEVEALTHYLRERADPSASGGWAVYAAPGETRPGVVTAGPSRLFPSGRYRLVLRARAESAAGRPFLTLRIREPGGRLLAARTVAPGELPPGPYRELGLRFELAGPTVLDFPVHYLGEAGLFLDRLAVVRD